MKWFYIDPKTRKVEGATIDISFEKLMFYFNMQFEHGDIITYWDADSEGQQRTYMVLKNGIPITMVG